jgi:transcriptional regulator NrdR family protein
MRCPSCKSVDHTCVLNTVHREDGIVRRRRGCRLCQIRWTTLEKTDLGSLIQAFVPRPVVGLLQPLADPALNLQE